MWELILRKGGYWGIGGGVLFWLWLLDGYVSREDIFFKAMLALSPFAPILGILGEGRTGLSAFWLGVLQTGANGLYFFLLGAILHFGLSKRSLFISIIPIGILFLMWVLMARFWGYL